MINSDNIALELDSLSKSFIIDGEEIHALKNISFSLKKGETLGVIGPNGAGKSTLLRVLSKVTKPSSGQASHEGTITSIIEIGTGFHSDLSGKENVYLNASMLGMSKSEIKNLYPSIVDFSGLEGFMNLPVKKYSSGMYLRLAFSIAFHAKIDVLLLDEVLAVGDADFRRKCYSKISELKQKGAAIILVSHHMEAILQFCDLCMYMDDGEILAFGNPSLVVEKYLLKSNEEKGRGIKSNIDAKENLSDKVPFRLLHLPQDVIGAIKLKNVELIAKRNDLLTTEEDFKLKITLDKIIEEEQFEIGIYLVDLSGNRVLIDSYSMRADYSVNNLPNGIYEITCNINGDLLSAGVYQLGIFVSKNMELVQEIESVATIRLECPEHDKKFGRNMGSIIRPKFDWKVQHQKN